MHRDDDKLRKKPRRSNRAPLANPGLRLAQARGQGEHDMQWVRIPFARRHWLTGALALGLGITTTSCGNRAGGAESVGDTATVRQKLPIDEDEILKKAAAL